MRVRRLTKSFFHISFISQSHSARTGSNLFSIYSKTNFPLMSLVCSPIYCGCWCVYILFYCQWHQNWLVYYWHIRSSRDLFYHRGAIWKCKFHFLCHIYFIQLQQKWASHILSLFASLNYIRKRPYEKWIRPNFTLYTTFKACTLYTMFKAWTF